MVLNELQITSRPETWLQCGKCWISNEHLMQKKPPPPHFSWQVRKKNIYSKSNKMSVDEEPFVFSIKIVQKKSP